MTTFEDLIERVAEASDGLSAMGMRARDIERSLKIIAAREREIREHDQGSLWKSWR